MNIYYVRNYIGDRQFSTHDNGKEKALMKISIKHLESLLASSLGYHSVAVDHKLSAIISIVSFSVAVFLLNINSVGIFHSEF